MLLRIGLMAPGSVWMGGSLDNRKLSILAFCFFDAWLLSFAYEGQVLYALYDARAIALGGLVQLAMLMHAAGLFACGFFIKSPRNARTMMAVGAGACLVGSGVFLLPLPSIWGALLLIVSFVGGLWNAAWGYFYRSFSARGERMKTVAASMASSTLLMIAFNTAGTYLSPMAGLIPAMLGLVACMACVLSVRYGPQPTPPLAAAPSSRALLVKSLVLLCIFIVTVTVTSGLMFQVINPAFAHLGLLPAIYWAMPYVASMFVVPRIPRSVSRGNILYVSLAMIGFGFLAYALLDHSASSYVIVNTLLLGAFGITDLFWWSILGEMLDFWRNPVRIMGIGLSVNVLGVLAGEYISQYVSASAAGNLPLAVAFASVCAALVVLPVLYQKLVLLLKDSSFLQTLEEMAPEERQEAIESLLDVPELTVREREVASLLLRGYTYRLIAQELFISESTVKSHIQSIYGKLGVRNRAELVQRFGKQ